MLKRLRRNLTITFIFMSLLIYGIVVPVGIIFFAHGLSGSVDGNLSRLLTDIQPSVTVTDGHGSLKQWAQNAAAQQIHILNVVQIFDGQGHLLESYGPPGVPRLLTGGLRADPRGHHKSIRSKFIPLPSSGYLQVQVDTQQIDDAITHFVITMCFLAPILLAATGLCGWFFAGVAVKPVARSLNVLRRFVADAAHELKTPTTIIQASAQTLEDLTPDGRAREIIEVLSRASARMRKLADDLVLLARMDSPEVRISKQVLSLDELIAQVCEEFVELAKSKNVSLEVGELPSAKIYGNADALSRVLINLIDNAIRYTEAEGTVAVSLMQLDQNWEVQVKDSGIGIPAENLPHIFDRFYRVDESRSRAVGGTGLGLSIVHAIVEAHGGNIAVSSDPGRGTTFTVTIPSKMVSISSQSPNDKRSEPLTILKN